jgi:hypothetical protein
VVDAEVTRAQLLGGLGVSGGTVGSAMTSTPPWALTPEPWRFAPARRALEHLPGRGNDRRHRVAVGRRRPAGDVEEDREQHHAGQRQAMAPTTR